MRITLNGVGHDVADDTTVIALMHDQVGSSRGSAVAIDGVVVPRSEWPNLRISPGQTVELITAVQGG